MEYQRIDDYHEGGEMSKYGLRITIKTIDGTVIELQLKSKERLDTGTYTYLELNRPYTHQSQIDREMAKTTLSGINCETWNAYHEHMSSVLTPSQLELYQQYWDQPVTKTQLQDHIMSSLQHYPCYNTKDFKCIDGIWNVILEIGETNVTLPFNTRWGINPGHHYDCPAKGQTNYHLIIDSDVVLFVRKHNSTFKTPFPSNSRPCTTGEYDRYLFAHVKSGTLPDKIIDINVDVWNAYTKYYNSL